MRKEHNESLLALEMVEMEEGNHEPRNVGGLKKTRKKIDPRPYLETTERNGDLLTP